VIVDKGFEKFAKRPGFDEPKQPSHVRIIPIIPKKFFDWETDVPELATEEVEKDEMPPETSEANVAPNVFSILGRRALSGSDNTSKKRESFVRKDGSIDPSVVNYLQELPPELRPPSNPND